MGGEALTSDVQATTEPAAVPGFRHLAPDPVAEHQGDQPESAASHVGGPGGRPAPDDGPGEAAAILAFEEANARPSTPAERKLLRGLAERFDPPARATGGGTGARSRSGWGWIAAAVYEAVEAGSAFVAPRRLREILARWERDGFPGDGGAGPTAARDKEAAEAEPGAVRRGTSSRTASTRRHDDRTTERTHEDAASRAPASGRVANAPTSPLDLLGAGPDLPLPHGHGSRRTWAFTVGLLAGALDRTTLAELVAGTAIVGYRDGEVTLAVPDAARADRLATGYRELITRKLSEAMRRPVRLAVLTVAPTDAASDAEAPSPVMGNPEPYPALDRNGAGDEEPVPATFLVEECGLPSGQVWSAVLSELANGDVSRANYDTWLRATALLGRGGDAGPGSSLVVGVPHPLAQRRVAARFGPHLRAAIAAVVGAPLPVDIVVGRDWLRANARPAATSPQDAPDSDRRRA